MDYYPCEKIEHEFSLSTKMFIEKCEREYEFQNEGKIHIALLDVADVILGKFVTARVCEKARSFRNEGRFYLHPSDPPSTRYCKIQAVATRFNSDEWVCARSAYDLDFLHAFHDALLKYLEDDQEWVWVRASDTDAMFDWWCNYA